jgi:hypothetical protein
VILNEEELEEIGSGAFGYCTSMEEIVIPDKVRAINFKAFRGCKLLMRVTLGSGLEEIGEEAFGHITDRLERLSSLLPSVIFTMPHLKAARI